ncbi:MAG: dihydroneopterin aldolase [Planctomycetota bacterium]|nr:dihydroneopterin aldolase [Planctomycetota bacterium]
MTDRISIEGLRLRAVIGVHEHERAQRQTVVVDLRLETDLERAGRSDDLADAPDYDALTRTVAAHVEASSFQLVEALARSILEVVFEAAPRVTAAWVRVEKPEALARARTVAIEMRRERG